MEATNLHIRRCAALNYDVRTYDEYAPPPPPPAPPPSGGSPPSISQELKLLHELEESYAPSLEIPILDVVLGESTPSETIEEHVGPIVTSFDQALYLLSKE